MVGFFLSNIGLISYSPGDSDGMVTIKVNSSVKYAQLFYDMTWNQIQIAEKEVDRSSRRNRLPKNLDFRCLMMVVAGIRGEREIQTKREVVHECSRGHVIQIRIRCTSRDLDPGKCVVCFYCNHSRFKEVLDMVEFVYKKFFMCGYERREKKVCFLFI